MTNVTDKRHWYDGWIYDRVLAPNQEVPFNKISELVKEGSEIIDIGCGTGRLDFRLAGKCNSILAIDLSKKNIMTAHETARLKNITNIEFLHSDLETVIKTRKQHFNYSILSYILHEVSRMERIKILRSAAAISDNIIVSDHKPDTTFMAGLIREVLEFGAGRDHYRNYRSYINDGGIRPLAEKCNLKIIHEKIHNSHLQIVVLEKL